MRSTESLVARARVVLVTASLVAAACGTPPGPMLDLGPHPVPHTMSSRTSYVIDGAALPPERMIVDVVRERWPQLVHGELPRGDFGQALSIDRFGVYDDHGAFLGGPEYLAQVRAGELRQIRRLTAVEESAYLGKRHPAGAVVLTWKSLIR